MASSVVPCQADYEEEDNRSALAVANAGDGARQGPPQREYDFVERPSEDFLCPVTLELLLDPHLTGCCGHHLSHETATRLQRDGKPCPMCKESNLTTMADKFFKRKVNELKVRCPHKASGCEWVGEVGSLDKHEAACPKRPWECEHCQEKGVYEIREGHMPKCTRYLTPCPNGCDVGWVPRCEVDSHVAMCPLQPVVCEFSHAGCEVVVPRREMARHMKEGAQQHLLTATLLNLSLTKKMQVRMENMEEKIAKLQDQVIDLKACAAMDAYTFDFTLDGYKPHETDWKSTKFYLLSKGLYGFKVLIDDTESEKFVKAYLYFTKEKDTTDDENKADPLKPSIADIKLPVVENFIPGNDDAEDSDDDDDDSTDHTSSSDSESDLDFDDLSWPVMVTGQLTLLNQLGDHTHHSQRIFALLEDATCVDSPLDVPCKGPFIPFRDLGHNVQEGTQYLKDNCLRFRLHIKLSFPFEFKP